LVSRLSTDAANVNQLITKVWGNVAQLCVTAITGVVIAFVNGWLLTIIVLACAPVLVLAATYETRIHSGFENQTKAAYERSGQVAAEAIKEIRTVAALTKQKYFEDRFDKAISRPHTLAQRKAFMASIAVSIISMSSNYIWLFCILFSNFTVWCIPRLDHVHQCLSLLCWYSSHWRQ
jgi:ABC-type multidrug transport system fused ATPase/permease subunit